MDGKFYDLPDDEASKFEVPREKVKALLEKAGGPPPQGGPGAGPGQGPGHAPGGGPGAGGPGGQVVVQIFAAGAGPGHGGHGGHGGPSGGHGQPQQQGEGDVEPYWWWRNFWPNWGNFWPNY
jgi:hypothetical protein